MALLNKDDILKRQDTKTKTVYIPEWDGEVIVSTMTGHARDKWESSIVGPNGGMNTTNIRAKLAAACLVDDKGSLLFTESDILKLGKKSSAALDRIFSEAQSLNSIGDNEVEELAKN